MWALAVALGGQMVVVLDFSIVNVALPSLSSELGISLSMAQWVVTAYALTLGGLLVFGGRAADLFGRRRLLIAGLLVFGGASALGGVAPNVELLVAARAVQGVAAAFIAPAALSILTTSFAEGPKRNRVLGYYGIISSIGFVFGLVAGGILVDTVGWRGVFFVNVPLCFALAALGARTLPEDLSTSTHHTLDVLGALLVTAGIAGLVLAPTFGTTDGWGSPSFLGCLLGGAALIGLFVVHESVTAEPLVPMSIFRHRTVVVGDVLAGLLGACIAAEVLVLSLYSQEVLGYSALLAGFIAIPQGIGGMLRGVVGPGLLDRVGLKPFVLAACALTAASIALLFRFPLTTHYPGLGVVLLGAGFGTTSVLYAATVAGSTGVADNEQGLAGALLNTTRQMGAAIGVAILLSLAGTGGSTSTSQLAASYRTALVCATGLILVGAAVVTFALPNRRRARVSSGAPAGPGTVMERATRSRAQAGGPPRPSRRDERARRRVHGRGARDRSV
ncbi:MAG: drug resistance transporter, EmrB/QacA subfamily [Actinomycetia bacterium]|nr:drug resistance transporter, EmrB/QacA subfamily [Actinomycetes bacterium]